MRPMMTGKALQVLAFFAILFLFALPLAEPAMAQQPDVDATAERAQQIADILKRHDTVSETSAQLGQKSYVQDCAACHDGGVDRAPPAFMLGLLSPDAIHRALVSGRMQQQASGLSEEQKVAVAEFLTGRALGSGGNEKPPLMCQRTGGWFDPSRASALQGWGFDSDNSHATSTAIAGLNRSNIGQLKLKWALAFPSVLYARSQPTLAGGAMFVGGDDGTVYALDPATGCAHWVFHAQGAVRMGIVYDSPNTGAPRLYFGDVLGNAYALAAETGAEMWRVRMDPHPNATLTASFALQSGVLYVPVSSLEEPAAAAPGYACCTFRGSLVALDAKTGAEKWRAYMTDPPVPAGHNSAGVRHFAPSGAAIWATPLVDAKRGQVYVVTGDNYSPPASPMSDSIVALDMADGHVRWHYQATKGDVWNVACGWAEGPNCPEDSGPDFDFGAAAVMGHDAAGKDYVLAGQKSGIVYAVDPDSGKLVWQHRAGRGGALGGVHFGIATASGKVFVPISDFPDGYEHKAEAAPGIHALDVATGDEVWRTAPEDVCGDKPLCHPGYGGAITVTDQLVFAGSTDGHMRIYDVADGSLLWDFDTDRPFEAVNGDTANGGSISGGSAPIAHDGQLIVNSGYGGLGKMPGNVMLVFGVN
ncbi:PQQ-binding-like beta-propeller repeat protein [Altererythrobacter salegens]|uniref:PQQ-binding-like beta-propeller repeat protein n=1 Tax=Croceibacterium salegens TaxID=1737568 RepID=A0A6I4SS35_9SPHN|nr:PQQ-binding-like beta-propeller repeat protein [Croceibacterium salegens]MXO58791.1 PQQ-binding-like beta-propeller repeat protein [Croceibacterium salegens]